MFSIFRHFWSKLKTNEPTQFNHQEQIYYQQLMHTARVTQVIKPFNMGRVYYRATYWYAICNRPLILGEEQLVYVTGQEGSTVLIVEPFVCDLPEKALSQKEFSSFRRPQSSEDNETDIQNTLTGVALSGMVY